MNRLFAAALILLGLTGAAAACPAWQNPGMANYATTGEDLWSPNAYSVVAGGSQQLRNCGFNHSGYVISNPDFEFSLSDMQRFNRLNVRVDNAGCDTVLLVNDSRGQWYFNDDGGNGLNASLNIPNPGNGTYDIWVGTYGSGTCGATLVLETF